MRNMICFVDALVVPNCSFIDSSSLVIHHPSFIASPLLKELASHGKTPRGAKQCFLTNFHAMCQHALTAPRVTAGVASGRFGDLESNAYRKEKFAICC
jgi:hypothetical protein